MKATAEIRRTPQGPGVIIVGRPTATKSDLFTDVKTMLGEAYSRRSIEYIPAAFQEDTNHYVCAVHDPHPSSRPAQEELFGSKGALEVKVNLYYHAARLEEGPSFTLYFSGQNATGRNGRGNGFRHCNRFLNVVEQDCGASRAGEVLEFRSR